MDETKFVEGVSMKGFRLAVTALAAAFLFSAASTAYADQPVGFPVPTAPDGATLLPQSGQSQGSDSSSADPMATFCTGNGSDWWFSGLPGTPKTIYFQSHANCAYPVTSLWGQDVLYFDEFTDAGAYETSGNVCNNISSCVSSGSYYNLQRSVPWMVHSLHWNVYAYLASGYHWIDGGTGSSCSGYYTRALSCSFIYGFNTPI